MTTVQSSLDFINESSSGNLEILKHLASSHMLISVAVTGVLSLQAGQLYSEKAR